MSVDGAPLEAAPGEIDLPDASPAALASLFTPRTRSESEPGVWSLLLVPVLLCIAMVIFVAVAPLG